MQEFYFLRLICFDQNPENRGVPLLARMLHISEYLINSGGLVAFLIPAGGWNMSSSRKGERLLDSTQLTGSAMVDIRRRLKLQARRWIGPKLRVHVASSDLIQETLAYTLERLSQLVGRPRHEVYRWMIRAMRYRLMRYVTMVERQPERVMAGLLTEPALEGAILEGLISAELRSLIETELKRLGPESIQLFQLYYVEELKFSEIAERQGKSPAAVRAAHYRLLIELRMKIEKHVR